MVSSCLLRLQISSRKEALHVYPCYLLTCDQQRRGIRNFIDIRKRRRISSQLYFIGCMRVKTISYLATSSHLPILTRKKGSKTTAILYGLFDGYDFRLQNRTWTRTSAIRNTAGVYVSSVNPTNVYELFSDTRRDRDCASIKKKGNTYDALRILHYDANLVLQRVRYFTC